MKLKNTRFGIVTDFYGIRISLEDAVRRLNKLGIRDLEIPGWHWAAQQDSPYDLKLHAERVKKLCSLLRDSGMNVQQFHSQFSLAADTEPNRAASTEKNLRSVDLAAELGAKALVIHIAGRHDSCRGISDQAIFDANVKTLTAMAKHSENTPVRLAIENLMTDTNRCGCRRNISGKVVLQIANVILPNSLSPTLKHKRRPGSLPAAEFVFKSTCRDGMPVQGNGCAGSRRPARRPAR